MASFTITAGNDSFAGGADDDQFGGTPGGIDTLSGGGGADTFNYSASGDAQGGTIDGGSGTDTVITGRLGTVVFSNVEILNTVYGFLGEASLTQLAAFQSIDASADPTAQIAITLSATAGGTIDFGTRMAAGHGLFLNASLLTSGLTVTGTALNDEFIATAFTDSFTGGAGNDTYRVNSAADVVIEAPGGGHDLIVSTASRSLAGTPDVEDLSFTESGSFAGTGNALANVITGYFGNDTLSGGASADTLNGGEGSDSLDGGDGADLLQGGDGDDSYFNPFGDAIVEGATAGYDTVYSNVSYVLSNSVRIERLFLTGTDPVSGTGNDFSNSIVGNNSNNTLDGRGGADTLLGGLGNDTYVDPASDTILEVLNQGTDTVTSSASFSLESVANVERLFLTGTAAIDGTANGLANQMLGNDAINIMNGRDGADTINAGGGADTVNGGSGADRLIGGLQRDKIIPGADNYADTIVYTLIGESTGHTRDVITGLDLNGEDKIDLPGTVTSIAAPVSGALSLATFNANLVSVFNAAALPVNSAALFTATSGDLVNPNMVYLIVDANGIAGYQANQDWVFQLENHTGTLDTSDFI